MVISWLYRGYTALLYIERSPCNIYTDYTDNKLTQLLYFTAIVRFFLYPHCHHHHRAKAAEAVDSSMSDSVDWFVCWSWLSTLRVGRQSTPNARLASHYVQRTDDRGSTESNGSGEARHARIYRQHLYHVSMYSERAFKLP